LRFTIQNFEATDEQEMSFLQLHSIASQTENLVVRIYSQFPCGLCDQRPFSSTSKSSVIHIFIDSNFWKRLVQSVSNNKTGNLLYTLQRGAFMQPLMVWKSKHCIFWVGVCSLSHTTRTAHAQYYIFVCGLSGSAIL
jgi:hypothetical protein